MNSKVGQFLQYIHLEPIREGVFHLEEPGQNLVIIGPSNYSISYKLSIAFYKRKVQMSMYNSFTFVLFIGVNTMIIGA